MFFVRILVPSLSLSLSLIRLLLPMAITEVQEPSEPLQFKRWVLKVSIHCEGCKKKVKKILNSVPGVHSSYIDVKQHRVVVTGNVEANALLKKFLKSGKHAELLLPPENPPQKEKKPNELLANKNDKPICQSHEVNNTQETPHAEEGIKPPPATIKPGKPPQVETSGTCPNGGGGGDGDKVADAAGHSTSGGKVVVEESKADNKKPETGSSGNQTPTPAVEVLKSGESESAGAEKAGVSGNVSKKKKKKGQSGNKTVAEKSSAVPASAESPNHDGGGPPATVPSNHSPPRHQGYQYPPSHYYAPPHAPVYAVSYNTAQPTSSYTASYYATPPSQSYTYSYPSQEMGPPPPPSDFDTYPPQPLDSFEMFSDENPNGCSIM